MRITNIMFSKRRRGVSTLLGTMIFIGILFTSVIPMMLVMKQADTVYTRKRLEVERLDDERGREDIEVYAFPLGETSSNVNVTVKNMCEIVVTIVRIWINDTKYEVNSSIPTSGTKIIGSFDVSPSSGSEYYIKAVSERGNVYGCESGIIYYGDTGWEYEYLGINVLIESQKKIKKYRVVIELSNSTTIYDETNIKAPKSGSMLKAYDVTEYGPVEYHVEIYKAKKKEWILFIEEDVEITWPSGLPVVWVYA